MAFKFKTSRARRAQVEAPALPRPRKVEEPIGLVQGQIPDSKEEYWCSVWLEEKRLDYHYQWRVFSGSQKYFYDIDFLVWTRPLATMIEINGAHWHDGERGADDRKRQIEIEDQMRDIAKIPIQFLWAGDLVDRDSLEAALERIFNAT